MTSKNKIRTTIDFPCWIVGLMSGTSADGVDAALLFTDGRDIVDVGPSVFLAYEDGLRADILTLIRAGENQVGNEKLIEQTSRALTLVHIEAVQKLREKTRQPISAIGFHGQTIYHAPERGVTRQIGDPRLMVEHLDIPVVADFRAQDVHEGGQGAPLVPLFHAALARKMNKPIMIVNIGGISNVTWLGSRGEVFAFDAGPGNALIDDWFFKHTGERFDEEGRVAARGNVSEKLLMQFAQDPFFAKPAPKSLDRQYFKMDIVKDLSFEDGTATLAAMSAFAIAKACELVPEVPQELLVSGGGRHNVTLMQFIRSYCRLVLNGGFTLGVPKKKPIFTLKRQKDITINAIGDVGWDGDMLEAQAFAYLAARSLQGLPLSLPSTTGVPRPTTGGVFYPVVLTVS